MSPKHEQLTAEEPFNISPEIDPELFKRFQKISNLRKSEAVRPVPILEAKNLVKRFGDHTVIPDLSFKIDDIVDQSEIISILGPSGCGKSTVLRMIAGLSLPTSGVLNVLGNPVNGPGEDRGMIFQKYSSFPFLNVLDNIAYPLIHVKHMNRREALDRAMVWVEKMYLKGSEHKFPHELSGGMQQRVAIARTICMEAKIILLDEPFGALDRKIRWEMQDLVAEILFSNNLKEVSMILVTHDIPEALYLGDRVWIMNKGQIISEDFLDRPNEPSRISQSKKEFMDMVSYFNEKIDNLELKK